MNGTMLLCLQGVATYLKETFNCCPVFMDKDIKDKYYKGGAPSFWLLVPAHFLHHFVWT